MTSNHEYHLVLKRGEPVIPRQVLEMILQLYEFGVPHEYKDVEGNIMPNVIKECPFGPDWATWDDIFLIREKNREAIKRKLSISTER